MLIIVESPAKAKTIRKIVGSKYKVEASVGHIRGLSRDSKTKDGRKLKISGIDIENNFDPIYEIDPEKRAVVKKLKDLLKTENEVFFATDSDREGEAISWHLAKVLGIKDVENIKRLEFHEITPKAINEALKNPRPLNLKLVKAQQARQVLDKLVGFGLSPVLWRVMGNRKLSAGRVQSPALFLLFLREKEILNFKPEDFWVFKGEFSENKEKANLVTIKKDEENPEFRALENELFNLKMFGGEKLAEKIFDKKIAKNALKILEQNNKYVVGEVEEKLVKNQPKPPFTTSTLQQAASSKLGFNPKRTMSLAQKLYEGVEIDEQTRGLITYMRTDSTILSQDALEDIKKYLQKNYPQFLPSKPNFYKSKSKNAQEAHEAIRPTDCLLEPKKVFGKMDISMYKLYELIWNQTIASQMTPEERKITTFNLKNEQNTVFSGSVSTQISAGFRTLLPTKNDLKQINLKKGDVLFLKNLFTQEKQTTPPSRYSPASLIKILEAEGVGRPSTYASIISTLLDRGYVEENAKSLQPTALGMKIAELLGENFQEVTSSKMTAKMEDNLDEISRGENEYFPIVSGFWANFEENIEKKNETIFTDISKYKKLSEETIIDPNGVGGEMVLKLGRFGEYWQSVEKPEIMYPKNFREVAQILKQNQEIYAEKIKGLVSPISQKPLVIRVSNASLNVYVATSDFKVGGVEKAISIQKLEQGGWKQSVVDEIYKGGGNNKKNSKKNVATKKTSKKNLKPKKTIKKINNK